MFDSKFSTQSPKNSDPPQRKEVFALEKYFQLLTIHRLKRGNSPEKFVVIFELVNFPQDLNFSDNISSTIA